MIRIGYPVMNLSVKCSTAGTLRLATYSEARFEEKVRSNLDCLKEILAYNAEHGILVHRISSGLIPFASHEVMTSDWESLFAEEFAELATIVRDSGIRISTHPGQFVLINSPKESVVANSVRELAYQARLLDLLGAPESGKVQIHVGGVYEDKAAAMDRFVAEYERLPEAVKRRLVIENDELPYALEDCHALHTRTGVPVLFDSFHHSTNPGPLSTREAFELARGTWEEKDGVQQMDYSQQDETKQLGAHSATIEPGAFGAFLDEIEWTDPLDIMLEVKDKEVSVRVIREALGPRIG